MAAEVSQKEMELKENNGLNEAKEDNPNVAVDRPHVVVSPPSAPNLTSLLTGHTGQEVETQATGEGVATDKNNHTQDDEQVDDNMKSPSKKITKKTKSTKDDKPAKQDCTG